MKRCVAVPLSVVPVSDWTKRLYLTIDELLSLGVPCNMVKMAVKKTKEAE